MNKSITTHELQPENSQLEITGIKVQTGLRAGKALGDSLADVFHFAGLDRLAALYSQVTGLDCGCKARQEKFNQLVPNHIVIGNQAPKI